MLRMVDTLDKFVAEDLPFLKEERTQRVEILKHLLTDPQTGVAEKYRRILEAYQIEADYGARWAPNAPTWKAARRPAAHRPHRDVLPDQRRRRRRILGRQHRQVAGVAAQVLRQRQAGSQDRA